jgi:hypothetical protein
MAMGHHHTPRGGLSLKRAMLGLRLSQLPLWFSHPIN